MSELGKNGASPSATEAVECEGLCQHSVGMGKGEERGAEEERKEYGEGGGIKKKRTRTSSENHKPEVGVVRGRRCRSRAAAGRVSAGSTC